METSEKNEILDIYNCLIDDNHEVLDIYNGVINDNHQILHDVTNSYLKLSQRFPLELGKLIDDLENKTADVYYVEKVMKAYLSIVFDVNELAEKMNLAIESSNQVISAVKQ